MAEISFNDTQEDDWPEDQVDRILDAALEFTAPARPLEALFELLPAWVRPALTLVLLGVFALPVALLFTYAMLGSWVNIGTDLCIFESHLAHALGLGLAALLLGLIGRLGWRAVNDLRGRENGSIWSGIEKAHIGWLFSISIGVPILVLLVGEILSFEWSTKPENLALIPGFVYDCLDQLVVGTLVLFAPRIGRRMDEAAALDLEREAEREREGWG